MTERTERHTAAPRYGLAGEGQHRMSERTAVPRCGLAGKGHEGVREVGAA